MDKEEFHAVLKLVSGEEIFAKVCPCEEEDKTLLILESPVIFEMITIRQAGIQALHQPPASFDIKGKSSWFITSCCRLI